MSEETNTTTEVNESSSTEVQTESTDSTLNVDTQENVTDEGVNVESNEEQNTEEPVEEPELSIEERYGDEILEKMMYGELSKEDFKALKDKGISKVEAELMMKSLKEDIEKNDKELMDSVGGESEYQKIQEYAVSAFKPEELKILDAAVRHDLTLAKIISQGIRAKMLEEQGFRPQVTIESGSNQSSVDTNKYQSRDEYFRDKFSKEYKTNPEFKRKVDAKRNASGF